MRIIQETSTEQYKKALSRKFKSVVGEPAWASLDKGDLLFMVLMMIIMVLIMMIMVLIMMMTW